MRFEEMDAHVTLAEQLQAGQPGQVVLINKFSVSPDERQALLDAWASDAAYFQRQPGFVSAQLHEGIAGSAVFLNYAVWESSADFARAFGAPEFRAHIEAYPSSTVASPHLFTRVIVPGVRGLA